MWQADELQDLFCLEVIRLAQNGKVVMDLSFSSSVEMLTICRRENVASFMFLLSFSPFLNAYVLF